MSTEVSLQNAAITRAIKKCAPCFEFTHARWSFPGMQLCHSPVVEVLPAPHGVRKVNAPVVSIVHVSHCRGDASLGHNGMRFAAQRLRNHRNLYSSGRGLHRSAQSRAARANDEHIV